MDRTELIGKTGITAENLKELYGLFKQFSQDYRIKPENVSDIEWAEQCFEKVMPELTRQESRQYAKDTLESVQAFNTSLNGINKATAKGISKEVWFANNTLSALEQFDSNICGNYLGTLDEVATVGNARLLDEPVGTGALAPLSDTENWSPVILKDIALHLGKNAMLTGLRTLVRTDEAKMFDDVLSDDVVCVDNEDFLSSDKDIPLKSAMTIALKTGIEKSLLPSIPANTSIDTLANISCMGVERIRALSKLMTGNIQSPKYWNTWEKHRLYSFITHVLKVLEMQRGLPCL